MRGVHKKEKNETSVEFNEEIDITDYVTDPSPITSYIAMCREEGVYQEPNYQITAVE